MDSNVSRRITAAVMRLKNGEMQAFDELYALTHDKVYFLALKMLRNKEDALEIVQDTYLSVYQSIGKLYNPEVFNTWLSKITVNKCRDFLGKNKEVLFSESQTDDEDDYDITDTIEETDSTVIPHEVLDSAETRNMVMALIDKLPVAQRTTLLLYYYQQFSVDEVAAIMDCPVATVKSRLQYARKQVKKGVEGYEAQGVKLYSIAAAPLILFALEETAKHSSLGTEAALQIYTAVKSSAASSTATSAGSAASSTAPHSAGNSQATAQNSPAVHNPSSQGYSPSVSKPGLIKKTAHFSLRTKVIAGVAAAAVVAGGVAVPGFLNRQHTPSPSQPALSATSSASAALMAPQVVTAYSYDNRKTDASGETVGLNLSFPKIVSNKPNALELNSTLLAAKSQYLSQESQDYLVETGYKTFVYKNILTVVLYNLDGFVGGTAYQIYNYDFVNDRILTQEEMFQLLSLSETDILQKVEAYLVSTREEDAGLAKGDKITGIFRDNNGSIIINVDFQEDYAHACLIYDKTSDTFSISNDLPNMAKLTQSRSTSGG
ncbi:MAG: RNA polymerase sigma factor [Sporolactobacillus sp.]